MARQATWKERWIKGGRLGSGGQGFTYYASEKTTDKMYAIKFLKKQDDPKRRERMFSEVANLKILDHPNIPRLI